MHQIDLDGRLLSMNRAGLAMLGLTRQEQIVGREYCSLMHERDRPRIRDLLRSAFAGVQSQFEFESLSGRTLSCNLVPIRDAHGTVVRVMGLTQDVTTERQLVREREEDRRRLELALHGTRQGLWDLDMRDDRLIVDESWARILGYSVADVAPNSAGLWALCHPDDEPRVRMRLAAHLRGETDTFESRHRMRSSSGEYRWVIDRAAVVARDADGRALRLTGTIMDISREHEAQQRRRELEAQLQQAQKMESIGQLAGGIAHDFNNLLTVISGNVELGLLDLDTGRSPKAKLEQIGQAAADAAALVRELLGFSGTRSVHVEQTELSQLVDGAVAMVRRVLPENIALRVVPCAQPVYVNLDAAQVRQVLVNLIVNARDAMPGGGHLDVETRLCPGEALAAQVVVRDDGHGMDERTASRAFDPFFTTKRANRGSGLGLAMVYSSMQQHRGEVRLHSTPGSGTEVILAFPECVAPRLQPASDAPIARTTSPTKILVVEDESSVRALAVQILEEAGHEVLCAADGEAGVALFAEHRDTIALVFLDVIMPRTNGVEAWHAIRSMRADTPVLFTTGYNQDDTLPSELLQGADLQLLPKPYSQRSLLQKVSELLAA